MDQPKRRSPKRGQPERIESKRVEGEAASSAPHGNAAIHIQKIRTTRYTLLACVVVMLVLLINFAAHNDATKALLLEEDYRNPSNDRVIYEKQGKKISRMVPKISAKWSSAYSLVEFVTGPAAPYYTHPNETNDNVSGALVFPMISETHAVCEFRDLPWSWHFPHAMQQLIRCFSWWQANAHQKPVLVMPNAKRLDYTMQFLEALTKIWHVQVRIEPTAARPLGNVSVFVEMKTGTRPFQMRSLHDAIALREGILQYYNFTAPAGSSQALQTKLYGPDPAQWPGCPTKQKQLPTLGFLNRKGGRNVVNYQEVLRKLEQTGNFSCIEYLESFDDLHFLDQAAFMSKVDILLSPHGAQLTSAFFQPTCGGLLELFPKGLCWGTYFGTLAVTTGHHHEFLYTGSQDPAERARETKYFQSSAELRVVAKNHHVLVDPNFVLEKVQVLTVLWRSCCKSMGETNNQ